MQQVPSRNSSRLRGRVFFNALALLLGGYLWGATSVQAQTCDRSGCGRAIDSNGADCAAPAKPVPGNRWGDLQPVDTSFIACSNGGPSNCRDATHFNEFRRPTPDFYSSFNWYMAADIENSYLITGMSHGIQVWDLANPENPTVLGRARFNTFPQWSDQAEEKWPLRDVDAPPGVDTVAAVAGQAGIGIAIFDLSNKGTPRLAYQSSKKSSEQVYAARIGGVNYAFLASESGSSAGLFAYNMTRAVSYTACLESAPFEAVQCPGVYLGRIGNRGSAKYVDGVDNYVVASSGAGGGFEIWDVSNPSAPQLKLDALTTQKPPYTPVFGVAMWREGSKYYVGLRTHNQGRIYDVSCISGTCSGPGNLVWSQNMDSGTVNFFVTFSRGNSVPYLYFGSDNRCSGGDQREWLFDVSNPAAPHDLASSNYWGWYYRGNSTGFNNVMPRSGKFYGDHFYRAGLAVLDIHKRSNATPPVADFAWTPGEVYPNTTVSFQDTTVPAATGWSWTFDGGSPSASAVKNPSVSFATAGSKTVTLEASNAAGTSAPRTRTVNVLNPAPAAGGVTVTPSSALICQPVTCTANGVTGQPPLTRTWQVLDPGSAVEAGPATDDDTFTFTSDPNDEPGTYKCQVTVSNTQGAPVVAEGTFQLNALPTLAFTGPSSLPTNDPFTSGTVNFHIQATGVTTWEWDFGDGTPKLTTSDPAVGNNPSHSYESVGVYAVTVKISNCVTPAIVSSALTVNVTQVTPLIALFQATGGVFCTGLGCSATVGQAITFADTSAGASRWDYDWNGDGDFTDTVDQADRTAPVTTHTYTTAGTFSPKLRVRRGSEEAVYTHRQIIVGSDGPGGNGENPTISVSGPSTGTVGQQLTYTATASNCTPGTTGWSWTTSSGTVSGDSNRSSITVSWTGSGSKSVRATNSGCSGASGTRSVSITGGGTDTGALNASYTYSPTAPQPNQAVSFNGTGSTGTPSQYNWTFGDGGSATGSTVSHTFTTKGSYTVKLTVTKPGSGPGCFSGTCADEEAKTVVVGTTDPVETPPSAEFEVTGAECINQFGFNQCTLVKNAVATLVASEPAGATYSWEFGDGIGSGKSITHSWSAPNTYTVRLTVTKGSLSSTKTRTFIVTGPPEPVIRTVILPWLAQTDGALRQVSDLYVYNPGSAAITVKLAFRKRGQPESTPPLLTQVLQPKESRYFADILGSAGFGRPNLSGFLVAQVEGDTLPLVTLFNTTFQGDSQFGQTIQGVPTDELKTTAPSTVQLIGLNDNAEQRAYFGLSNYTENPATLQLKFFNSAGQAIGTPGQLVLSRLGQRQYQLREIRETFGVENQTDYRVQVETVSGGPVVPYAANLRVGSDDPAFVGADLPLTSQAFLVGIFKAPGLNNSLWQSDLVLENSTSQALTTHFSFQGAGSQQPATSKVAVTLQAGETKRLADVLKTSWNLTSSVGVVIAESATAGGPLPILRGEVYDVSKPGSRYGQTMRPHKVDDAADAGESVHLVGLRQDAHYRSTLSLYNLSTAPATYDLIYRRLDGTEIAILSNQGISPGKFRQYNPGQHPLPASGEADGFTVEVKVKSGKVLCDGQVVNNQTNDPASISGRLR